MKKKAPAGRVSEKKKTEKILKKIKADLSSSSKPERKRKKTETPPSPRKAPQKKVMVKASARKGKARKKEEPEKSKKKTGQEVSPKKRKPPVTKAGAKKEKQAVSKKPKTIAAGKKSVKLTGKDKSVKKAKPEKTSAKAATAKKPKLSASGKQRAVPKSSVKPARKVKAAAGTKTEIKKKTVKRKKPLIAKKKKAALSEEIKKEKVTKILRPEVRGRGKKKIKAGRTHGVQRLTDSGSLKTGEAKETREEKKAYSAGEGILPPASFETLPSEYGENSIHLITINPQRIFAFWEVKEDTLRIFQGVLTLRQYDITELDFERGEASSYVDSEVNARAGALYLDVEPARDYIAEIGVLYAGGNFITIARSYKVSTPHATIARADEFKPSRVAVPEETGFTEKQTETETRAGYSGG